MDPLAAVLAGHLIGDWIVQTDWQAANKARSWRANQLHMLGYHLTLAVFCAVSMSPSWALVTVVVSWATHSIIDRRWPVTWLMRRTGSGPFAETSWGPFVVDQALHIAILAVLAGLA